MPTSSQSRGSRPCRLCCPGPPIDTTTPECRAFLRHARASLLSMMCGVCRSRAPKAGSMFCSPRCPALSRPKRRRTRENSLDPEGPLFLGLTEGTLSSQTEISPRRRSWLPSTATSRALGSGRRRKAQHQRISTSQQDYLNAPTSQGCQSENLVCEFVCKQVIQWGFLCVECWLFRRRPLFSKNPRRS